MTMSITTDVATIEPIGHREAYGLAEEAYRRIADLLGSLDRDDWAAPTMCPGWTVRDMAGHLVGAMRSAASRRELLSQQREIKRRVTAEGGNEVDTMTQVQIDRVADLDVSELVAECRALVRPAAIGRRRTPAPMRRFVRIPVEMGSISETWRLGYLVDVILTRDAWMHLVDIAHAVERPLELDAAHDGRIVADIVAEWARRHGQPFDLTLTGPAGGRYSSPGDEPARLELDPVVFCLAVSGRHDAEGLLAEPVPF